jgi:hypothetical protein
MANFPLHMLRLECTLLQIWILVFDSTSFFPSIVLFISNKFGLLSLFQLSNIWTSCEVHPAYYSMGTGSYFPGGKMAGGTKVTTHLHLLPRLRQSQTIPPVPQYTFTLQLHQAQF